MKNKLLLTVITLLPLAFAGVAGAEEDADTTVMSCDYDPVPEFDPIFQDADPDNVDDDFIRTVLEPVSLVYQGPTPYFARLGHVVSQTLTGTSDFLGDFEITLDETRPLVCTLIAINPDPKRGAAAHPGVQVFPAVHTVHLHWVLVSDSLPTMRTIEPVTLVADSLWGWPQLIMPYQGVTDAYFEDIANPGDTLLMVPTAGLGVSVRTHVYTIPALTNYGLIVLLVMLIAAAVYLMYRKRSAVGVRA